MKINFEKKYQKEIQAISSLKEIKPSKEWLLKSKADLLSQIEDQETKAKAPQKTFWLDSLRLASSLALFFLLLGLGISYTAEKSLPGDFLFSVKIGIEKIKSVFTAGSTGKINFEVKLAGKRIKEIDQLLERSSAKNLKDDKIKNLITENLRRFEAIDRKIGEKIAQSEKLIFGAPAQETQSLIKVAPESAVFFEGADNAPSADEVFRENREADIDESTRKIQEKMEELRVKYHFYVKMTKERDF